MTSIKVNTIVTGRTLWENPSYVSPAAQRSMLKRMKAGKYLRHVESKAAYEANKPTEPTYTVDQTDDVFQTMTDAPKKTDFRSEAGGHLFINQNKNSKKERHEVHNVSVGRIKLEMQLDNPVLKVKFFGFFHPPSSGR